MRQYHKDIKDAKISGIDASYKLAQELGIQGFLHLSSPTKFIVLEVSTIPGLVGPEQMQQAIDAASRADTDVQILAFIVAEYHTQVQSCIMKSEGYKRNG